MSNLSKVQATVMEQSLLENHIAIKAKQTKQEQEVQQLKKAILQPELDKIKTRHSDEMKQLLKQQQDDLKKRKKEFDTHKKQATKEFQEKIKVRDHKEKLKEEAMKSMISSATMKKQRQQAKDRKDIEELEFMNELALVELTQNHTISLQHQMVQQKLLREQAIVEQTLSLEQYKRVQELLKDQILDMYKVELSLFKNEFSKRNELLIEKQKLAQNQRTAENNLIKQQQNNQLQIELRIKTKEFREEQKTQQREWLAKNPNTKLTKAVQEERRKEMERQDKEIQDKLKKDQLEMDAQLQLALKDQLQYLGDLFIKQQQDLANENITKEELLKKEHKAQEDKFKIEQQQKQIDKLLELQKLESDQVDAYIIALKTFINKCHDEQKQFVEEKMKETEQIALKLGEVVGGRVTKKRKRRIT